MLKTENSSKKIIELKVNIFSNRFLFKNVILHICITWLLGRRYQNICDKASGDLTLQGFPVTLGQLFWYVALEGMYTFNSRWQCNAAFFKTIEPDMVSVSVMVFKYCRSMSNDYMNLYYRCILARIIYFLTTIIAV